MKVVERSELLDLARYEEIREPFRRRIIELKRVRRVALGTNITVLFENHDTVLYQIQEMLRTERITREDAVAHELETYNALIPVGAELSTTIFIEYPEREERERMLTELEGIESRFYIEVLGSRMPVQSEPRATLPGRTTAVHYAKFPLTQAAVAALGAPKATAVLGVDHPAYSARAELPPRTLEELAQDVA